MRFCNELLAAARRTRLGDASEGRNDAEDGAEETDERSHRADRSKNGQSSPEIGDEFVDASFGVTLLESMSCGTTMIVSDIVGRPQEIPRTTIGASYGDALLAPTVFERGTAARCRP